MRREKGVQREAGQGLSRCLSLGTLDPGPEVSEQICPGPGICYRTKTPSQAVWADSTTWTHQHSDPWFLSGCLRYNLSRSVKATSLNCRCLRWNFSSALSWVKFWSQYRMTLNLQVGRNFLRSRMDAGDGTHIIFAWKIPMDGEQRPGSRKSQRGRRLAFSFH